MEKKRIRKRVRAVCQLCKKTFMAKQDRVHLGKAKYCSVDCFYEQKRNSVIPIKERLLIGSGKNKRTCCIEWIGYKNEEGYGTIRYKGKVQRVHRVSWQVNVGDIPSGLLVCHKCDNPPCINPDHLFLGTYKDNSDDKYKKNRHPTVNRTHCKWGHEYTKENTRICKYGGRVCKTCRRNKYRTKKAGELL